MAFALPRDGAVSPRVPALPALPESLLEQTKRAGKLTPRGGPATPRVSPITPRLGAAPLPPHLQSLQQQHETRSAALLAAAESGAAVPPHALPQPALRPPAPPSRPQRADASRYLTPLLQYERADSAGGSSTASGAAAGDSCAAGASRRSRALALLQRLLPTDMTRADLRVPTQMFVAVAAATLLFVFRQPHAFLHGKGLWTAITVILVLEPTFGATSKKVKLRMLGTVVGGGLGGAIVAVANVINGGWAPPPGQADAVPKSLTVVALVSLTAFGLELGRLRDPNREYAYSVAMITMTLASLSDFYEADWLAVRVSVWWRCCTIVIGVAISGTVCMLVLPVFAGDVARDALADALRTAAQLLSGVTEVYLTDEDGDGHVDGRSGTVAGEHGVDDGLAERHAPLHALEDGVARALERLRPAVQQASEEARCASVPIECAPFARAGGRARTLYTAAVALLHFLESDFIRIRLCTRHAGGIRAARDAICAAAEDLARRVVGATPAAGAAPALAAAEAAVAALLAAVAADPLARPGGQEAADASISAADVESLGHLCFALADALRQLKLIVSDLDAGGRAAMAQLEAAVAPAAQQVEESQAAPVRNIGGRRVSTLM